MKLQRGVILWLDVVAHRESTRLTPQSPVVIISRRVLQNEF